MMWYDMIYDIIWNYILHGIVWHDMILFDMLYDIYVMLFYDMT